MRQISASFIVLSVLLLPTSFVRASDVPALSFDGFVANGGQWEEDVRFGARTSFGAVRVTDDGFTLVAGDGAGRWDIGFEHAAGVTSAERPRSVRHSFFTGATRAVGLPVHDALRRVGVAEGVDLVLRATDGTLRFDLELAPGRDAADVTFTVAGVDALGVGADGALELRRDDDVVRLSAPVAWAVDRSGDSEPVAASFECVGSHAFRLRASRRAEERVVVDPTVVWTAPALVSTGISVTDIVADAANVYVTGTTLVPAGFVATSGAADALAGGSSEAFVARLDAATGALGWVTFLGGTGDEWSPRIALAPNGDVVAVGITSAPDFPVTAGAYDTVKSGFDDVFVARLAPSGQTLKFATYLGGSVREGPATMLDHLVDVDVDAAGVIHVAGHTTSPDFPTTPGAFASSIAGGSDGFVARLDATGSTLLLGTYVGGFAPDGFGEVAALPDGSTLALGFGSAGIPGIAAGQSERMVLVRVPASGAGVAFGAAPLSGPVWSGVQMRLDADGQGVAYVTLSAYSFPGFWVSSTWRFESDAVIPLGLGQSIAIGAASVLAADDGSYYIVGPGIDTFPGADHAVGLRFDGGSGAGFERVDLGSAASLTVAGALAGSSTLYLVTNGHPSTAAAGFFVTRTEFCGGVMRITSDSCVGSTGPLPFLTITEGCHSPGGALTLRAIDDEPVPTGPGFVLLGFGAGFIPLTASCALDMGTVIPVVIPMIPDLYSYRLDGVVPPTVPTPFTFRGQAVLPNATTPDGWAVSGSFEATIDV